MKEKSSIKNTLPQESYKSINCLFPLIEGNFLQKYDEITVLGSLMSEEFKSNITYGKTFSHLSIYITFTKNIKLIVNFNKYDKKIRLIVSLPPNRNLSKQFKINDRLIKSINNKFNLTIAKNVNRQYHFKYNVRNCNKIINILKYVLINNDKLIEDENIKK